MERIRNKKASSIAMVLLVIAVGVVALVSIPEMVSASNDWYVNSAGGADFLTINQALISPQVQDGDTIYVYCGNGYSESNQITKSVSIIGITNNGQRPMITPSSNSPVFDIKKQDVTIRNLEICGLNSQSQSVHGIRSGVSSTEVSNVEIDNCIIYNFSKGNGIFLNKQPGDFPYPTSHYIHDCIIYGNTIGIHIKSDPNIQGALTNHVVSDCIMDNNHLSGIQNEGDNNEFNDIESYNSNNYGVYFLDSSGCKLYQTETGSTNIYNNKYGIYIVNCEGIDITGYGNDSENDHLMIEENNLYGIYAVSSDDIQLLYVIIQSNSLLGLNYDSVLNSYVDYSIIKDNDIFLYNSDYNIFTYNDIYDSSEKIEIGLHGSDHNYFYYNNLDRESPSCFFNIFKWGIHLTPKPI
ncbi:MAG: hypothetical protein QCI82_01920 [Candidatus Thermoplasmatota archaeon]|nr:hypothetical protein [Candidatus Thermoplasmatota archaeon]